MFLLLIATSPVLVVMEACIMRELQELQDKGAKVHVQTLFQIKDVEVYIAGLIKITIII